MTVKIMEPTIPLKPAKSGYEANEFFDLEAFKTLEGDFYVEPKYDGIRLQAHRQGKEVKLFTDDGSDITSDLPAISAEILSLKPPTFILDGELVIYNGQRQPLPHEAIVSAIHKKGPADEAHIRYKVFDILWLEDKATVDLPLKERKEILSQLSDTNHVHKVESFESKGGDELVKTIQEHHTTEGAVIKEVSSKYGKQYAKDWYKYKLQHEIDAQVIDLEETPAGAYVYTCGILDEKGALVEIGKTFATSIKAQKGEILRVAVDRVSLKDGKPSWLIPKVMDVRDDKKEPDAIALIKQLAHSQLWDQALAQLQMKGEFTLQAHYWGKSSHYDLRMTKEKGWFGFTIPMPGEPTNDGKDLNEALEGGKKLLAFKKAYYGGMEWMDYGKETPKEFEPGTKWGNPSKDYTAFINAVDWGKYELEKRTDNEFVILFQGEKNILDGRYFIIVAPDEMQSQEKGPEGEESEKWLVSQAKEQPESHAQTSKLPGSAQPTTPSEPPIKSSSLHFASGASLSDPQNKVVLVTIIKPGTVQTPTGKVVYSEKVLSDSVPLWDGAACFCDHFNKSVRNIAGVYYAPYYEDGVKAKLRFIDESLYKLVSQIIQDKDKNLPVPDIGISADINVKFSETDHTLEVTHIAQVISADIVFSPAAGGSFDRVLNAAGISPIIQNQPPSGSPPQSAEELVPVSRVRDLQSANDKLRETVKTLNLTLSDAKGLSQKLQQDIGEAVKKYRESLIKANPGIPEELLKGESITDLDASLTQAQAIVEKIKANLEGEAVIPAGSPSRKGPDISELSPVDKIKYGLHKRT